MTPHVSDQHPTEGTSSSPERPRPLAVKFRTSLALSAVVDLSFVALAEEFEGFPQWVYSTYAALSADLRRDVGLLFKFFGQEVLFHQLLQETDALDRMPSLIRWIGNLDSQLLRASHIKHLAKLARNAESDFAPVDTSILDDPPKVSRLLHEQLGGEASMEQINALAEFICDPEAMKAQLIYIMTRFWDRHYGSEYARCLPMQHSSIERWQQQELGDGPLDVFRTVTGREAPDEVRKEVSKARRLLFVPSCHTGPYVQASRVGDAVAVVFNCRPKRSTQGGVLQVEQVFPPLKALADETRLEILTLLGKGERYAQQVVDRMDVSQSAVSRHLRPMVTGGVLRVRKQDSMKFYRINERALRDLAEQLSLLADEAGAKE